MYRRIFLIFLLPLVFLPLAMQRAGSSKLLIIQNKGQYPAPIRYLILGGSRPFYLTDRQLWWNGPDGPAYLTLPGANPHLVPSQPRPVNISYYRGADPFQWYTRLPVFGRIRYTDLASGASLDISEQNGQITLQATHALELDIFSGDAAPRTWTLHPGTPTPLEQVLSPTHAGETHPAQATSPTGSPLLYGTFLGSDGLDQAHAIATDDLGRIYLAGQMLPIPPPPPAPQSAPFHAVEAFLARFTPDGSDVDYLTIILGDVEDWGRAVAVNEQYEAFFTGETDSTNYPTTPGAYDTTLDGSFDIFLTKFDADGEIVYSTLLGKSQWDSAYAVEVDATGHAYIAGDTWSPDFPTTADAFDAEHSGPRDAYVAKFSPDGSELVYSTFLGGDNIERVEAMALPEADVVYLAGWTTSVNFPTTPNAYDTSYNNAIDAFAVQLNLGSDALTYGTFLGGSGEDRAYDLALDEAGNLYLAGLTASSNFPATPGAYDTSYSFNLCDGLPCPDAFAARLSANGQFLDYATFLGDTAWDQANGVAVDAEGKVYLTGEVNSSNFPTSPDALDPLLSGGRDAFLTVFNSTFNALEYSTFLGGSAFDVGLDLWLGKNGGIFIAGTTLSTDFPVTTGAYDTEINGDYDGFAVLLSLPLFPYLTPTPSPIPMTPSSTPTPTLTPTPTSTPVLDPQAFMPIILRAP